MEIQLTKPEFLAFTDQDSAENALASAIFERLATSLTTNEKATLVVSGGSTPKALFRRLAGSCFSWNRVALLPSDERWVPKDHPQSNERMIRSTLMTGGAAEADYVSLLPAAGDTDLQQLDQTVSALSRPFGHVLLGMGSDGHTASLFPGAPELEAALTSNQYVAAISPPAQDIRRLSLTPKALLDSQCVSLLVFGEEKRAVLDEALAPGPIANLPVRVLFQQQQTPVTIYWAP